MALPPPPRTGTARGSVVAQTSSHGPAVKGSFRTAPSKDAPASLRLAFGGDLAGQNVCRDAPEDFPIMKTVRARRPDVFVGLGDMVYADDACSEVGRYGNAQVPGDFGPAADLPTFWAHWRYTHADARLQRQLQGTDYVGLGRPRGRQRLRAAHRHTQRTPLHARCPPAADRAAGLHQLHAARGRRRHAAAPVSIDPLGQDCRAVRARYPPVPRSELRRRHGHRPQDDART